MIDKWGAAATTKRLTTLGTPTEAALGVLKFPTSASAHAHSLRLGNLPATLSPAADGETIGKVNASAAGSTAARGIDAALAALGLNWHPWNGKPGGLAGEPVGADLPTKNEAAAHEDTISVATMVAAGQAGEFAVAALKAIGLIDAAGKATAGELGAFLAAPRGSHRQPVSSPQEWQ